LDYDDVVLDMDTDVEPETLARNLAPSNPQRSQDTKKIYSFDKWTKIGGVIENWNTEQVTGNVQYKASYTSIPRPYTVTFYNEDETTVLQPAAQYNYDTPASSITKPADPTKQNTAQYTYTFA
jgi:hypothetical protein